MFFTGKVGSENLKGSPGNIVGNNKVAFNNNDKTFNMKSEVNGKWVNFTLEELKLM